MTGQRADCHAHIIDPDRFGLVPGAGYQPKLHETGTREDFVSVLDANGIAYALLVQPSGYGFDNAAMLDAMAAYPGRFKAIAMLDPETGERELEALDALGVIGVRFNLVSYAAAALSQAAETGLLQRLKVLGWYAQIFASDEQWPNTAKLLRTAGVKVLIDHFGLSALPTRLDQAGFKAVLALGRDGLGVIKLSAPFRLARAAGDYSAVAPFAEAVISSFGIERCLWGSDWPFIAVDNAPAYADERAALALWVTDAGDRSAILSDNPCRLLGFGNTTP